MTYGFVLKGAAYGFKLDSLLKLTDVRAADNKQTLLHFIAAHIEVRKFSPLSLSRILLILFGV